MSTRFGKLFPWVGAAALVVCAQAARADELAPTEGRAEPYQAAEEAKEPTVKPVPGLQYVDRTFDGIKDWFDKHGLTIGSGLSTAFMWNFNQPGNFKNQLRFNDNFSSRYYVDLFQISLGYNPTPEKGQFGWFVKGDTGRIARRLKSDWNGSGFVPDTSWEHDEVELQAAYVMYNIPIGNGLTLKGGKFDTLVGAEVAEPWLNPNFGRSFLYTLAEPATHTGGLATYPITDMVSVTAGGIIGWDVVEDNNGSPSVTGQVAVVPNDRVSVYVNGIYGPEQACNPAHSTLPGGMGCNRNKRGLVDAVATIKLLDPLTLSMNYDWASEDEASAVDPGRHSTWQGFSGILIYDPIKRLEFALRGEWFEDAQGSRTGLQQTLWEVTTSARVLLSDHIYTRAEYRHDESTQKPFLAGDNIFLAGQDTVALELGYWF